jgi:glycosyltransferase involved in cell wall biosynthesis
VNPAPTVAILANRGFAVTNSRLPLVARMREAGWRVLLITADDAHARQVEALGATLESAEFDRGGLSPWRDFRTLARLTRLFSRHRPDLVHFFHSKPIMLGSLAIAAIPGWRPKVVSTITGLGYAYLAGGIDWLAASAGYRALTRRSDAVIFQNRDDRDVFVARGWIGAEKAVLIESSGVDTAKFTPRPQAGTGRTVVMVSRLLRQKGVQEYLDAARAVAVRHPDVEFQLAGEIEAGHADGIPEEEVQRGARDAGVRFLGYMKDVPGLFASARMLVFPSYYREGLPRIVIEAGACGVPAVAADVPGSRDAIEHGVTGLLVPPRDHGSLVDAICALLEDDDRCQAMGRAARAKALAEFDLRLITDRQLDVYRSLLGAKLC